MRVTRTTGYHTPTKGGIGGRGQDQVGGADSGIAAKNTTPSKGMSMNQAASSGASPKMKSTTKDH